ncbi:MAG: NACHT domain-containing protein [Cyanobacteria bacterium SBLK]|nr:NACHT domain-containing protein [Cyanobacteria bacterium SBLK]
MTAIIETLAIAAISGIAVPIFQSIWETGGKALDFIGKGVNEQTRQLIFSASQQYATNYTERHGTLKVLGMREPVNLESVYTTVRVLDEESLRQFESLEDREENFRQGRHRRFTPNETQAQRGIDIAKLQQYLIILGAPGAGKSTFLKRVGLEALKGQEGEFEFSCIPIFIELKRFDSADVSLEDFITKEFEISGFPTAENFTRSALEQGKLLILLDGLDEVPSENLNPLMGQIQDFVDRYADNRYIISCRTEAVRSSLSRFTDVVIGDFDDGQIEEFIQHWFSSDRDREAETAQKCWQLLQKPKNAAAKELAHTPLLLTFLCRVYDRSQNFPNNRSVLYRKALRILLEEWASEKRIQLDEIYQGLHAEAEEILLSEIAYQGFTNDRFFFSKRELVEPIKTFLTDNLNAPQNLDGESILNAIVIQQGIIVKRAEDVYSFSHVTLQEYLAAQYISDNDLIEKITNAHLKEMHWQEVFVLIAGLMRGGADRLLLWMEREADRFLETPEGQTPRSLLEWSDRITTDIESKYEPTAKRAIAIALALALTPARHLAEALAPALTRLLTEALIDVEDNRAALELAQRLQQLEIFQGEAIATLIEKLQGMGDRSTEGETFNQHLQHCFLEAFALTPELMCLSETEIQVFKNYLYANQSIVRCKQAAVRVSPQTWTEIESRMLRVSK